MSNLRSVIVHAYASPYYDPVKAHEYYEEHKKLKGNARKINTGTLNESGKKASLYVKKQLDEEEKAKREETKNKTLDQIKSESKALKSNIESLRVRLKMMNPAQRKQAEIHIRAEIQRMKDANNASRKALLEQYGADSKALREEYYNKYADEVDAMNKDASMRKAKKGSSKSGSDSGHYVFTHIRQQKAASK